MARLLLLALVAASLGACLGEQAGVEEPITPEVSGGLPQLPRLRIDLDDQMSSNRKQEALTLASLAEEETRAVQARAHRMQVAAKKKKLCALAEKLRAKLQSALVKSRSLEGKVQQMRAESMVHVTNAKRRSSQHQRALGLSRQLSKELVASKQRYVQTKEKVVEMETRVHRRTKYEMQMAEEQAEDIVKKAKAQSAALLKRAKQRARRELSAAKQQEQELLEDARAEQSSVRRKATRANRLVSRSAKLSSKSQGQAWGLMSKTQQLQVALDRASADVKMDKKQLRVVQQKMETLQ